MRSGESCGSWVEPHPAEVDPMSVGSSEPRRGRFRSSGSSGFSNPGSDPMRISEWNPRMIRSGSCRPPRAGRSRRRHIGTGGSADARTVERLCGKAGQSAVSPDQIVTLHSAEARRSAEAGHSAEARRSDRVPIRGVDRGGRRSRQTARDALPQKCRLPGGSRPGVRPVVQPVVQPVVRMVTEHWVIPRVW